MWPVICRDVEATIWFYQDFLGFPLVELVENRDNPGSSHVFFDLGNRNLLGFFDLPGHEYPPFSETIRGVQHIAISVGPSSSRRREAFDEYLRSDRASTTACTSRSQRDQPRAVPRGAGAVQRRVPAPLNPHGRPPQFGKGEYQVPTLRQGSSRSSVSVRNSEGEMWNGGRSRSMQRRMLAPAALPSQESPVFCYALPTLTEEASRGGQASSCL